MKRIALDTNAVNRLADTPGLVDAARHAHERGALVFVVNHVVEDQLATTEDLDWRALLLDTWTAMPQAEAEDVRRGADR